MKSLERFNWLLSKFGDDPEYISEAFLIDINEQIIRLLEEKQITRLQLAQTLGVSNAYITNLLNGNDHFTVKQLVALGRALNETIRLMSEID